VGERSPGDGGFLDSGPDIERVRAEWEIVAPQGMMAANGTFIDYNGTLKVHNSLLSVILHE